MRGLVQIIRDWLGERLETIRWALRFRRQDRKQIVSRVFATVVIVVLILSMFPQPADRAIGAYSTSTTDADGNTHLGSNTVNDTYYYDTTQDSSSATQQQLGVDPNWKSGVVRESSALSFDGTSDYTTGTLGSSITGDFTLEFWFKTSTIPASNSRMIDLAQSGSSGLNAYINTGGALVFDNSNGPTSVLSQAAVTDGAWHHVAISRSQTSYTLYFDGTFKTTVAGTTVTYTRLFLGTPAGLTSFYAGTIDEVQVSNAVRYTAAFTPVRRFKEDTATYGLWHFDEGSGQSIVDASVLNGDMTLGANSGSSTDDPTWVTGSNALMDGFDGAAAPTSGNRSGAGNITLGEQSSTTNDKAYEMRVTGSNALTLDGTDDYVDTTDNNSLETAAVHTVEAWIFVSSAAANMAIVDKYRSGTTEDGWQLLVVSGGKVQFTLKNDAASGVAISSNSFVNNSRWHHVAAVWNTITLTASLFIDGQLEVTGTPASGAYSGNTRSVRLGVLNNDVNPFLGTIDEVRISSSARYVSTFTPSRRFATDADTAALWHLDEGSGTTSADASGNSFNGTLRNGASNSPAADGTTNGPIWAEGVAATAGSTSSTNWALPGYNYRQRVNMATTTAIGAGHGVETTLDRGAIIDNKQSRADGKDWRSVYQPSDQYRSLSFDGSEDFVNVANESPFRLADTTFTAEGWVKTTLSSEGVLVGHGALSGSGGWSISVTGAGLMKFTGKTTAGSTAFTRSSSSAVNDGQWHHLAAVVTTSTTVTGNNTVTLYVDGVQNQGSLTQSAVYVSDTNPLTIGRRPAAGAGGLYFTGSIDEVRVSSGSRYSGSFTPARTSLIPDTTTLGLWHLDQGSGQTIVDASTNQNHGTLGADSASSTDDPTWLTGATADGAVSTVQEVPRFLPHGHALTFSGSNYMENNSVTTAGDFTAEEWFKSTYTSTNTLRIMDIARTGSTTGLQVTMAGTTGQVNIGDTGLTNSSVSGPTGKNDGAWHHVAVTRQGPVLSLFVDGVFQGKTTAVNTPTYSQLVAGNGIGHSAIALIGELDEVRMSNTVRYKNNFTPQTTPFAKDANTVVLWHLDDGSGSTAADQTGTYTGTISGATWVTNGGKVDSINQTQFKTVTPVGASTTDKDYYIYYGNPNEQGSAQTYSAYGVLLDGTDDYVDSPAISATSLTGLTYAFWFKTSGAGVAMTWGDLRNCNISVTTSTKLTCYVTGGSSGAAVSSSVVNNGVWHHAVYTSTASNQTLYVDGAQEATATQTLSTTNGNGGGIIRLGRNIVNTSGKYTGLLDDVRVYTRALTAAEVTALYTNTPTVSTSNLVAQWKFDDPTAAGTTVTDSSGNNNTGTLTNFNFAAASNWVVNKNLLNVTTDPTQTLLVTEQESPTFYQWRQAAGTWSARAVIPVSETQLGSEGVYVRFNPNGIYSRQDYYKINSWAVEAFTTSAPARGKKRAFPTHANIVSDSTNIDIIDADTNKVWMRLPDGVSNVTSSATKISAAKNGQLYGASGSGLFAIELDRDASQKFNSSGNGQYNGTIADRNDALGYATASGSALASSTVSDVSATVISNAQYVAVALPAAMAVIVGITATDPNNTSASTIRRYGATTGSNYSSVVLTSGGELYGGNTCGGCSNFARYDDIHLDSADQTSSTDRTYNTSSTPAIRSTNVNDISVTEATSTAESGSNTVAIAHDLGVDVIQEHSTQASGTIRYYTKAGSGGTSGWTSKAFGGSMLFDGSNDYAHNDAFATSLTADMTVEFWANTTMVPTAGNTKRMLDVATASVQNMQVTLQPDGTVGLNGAANITTSKVINDGVWHHIAVTRSGTTFTIYVDGVSVGSATGTVSTLTRLFVGSYAGLIANTQETVDEVRVSNNVRYTGAFTPSAAPFVTDANTSVLWHFDEKAGQIAYDGTSAGNNGTLGANSSVASDDPLFVSPSIGGTADKATTVGLQRSVVQNAAQLTAANSEQLSHADNASLSTGDIDFSLGAWVYLDSVGATRTILARRDGNTPIEYILQYSNSLLRFQFLIYDSGGSIVGTATANNAGAPSTGAWYYVLAWHDSVANTVNIQVNGGTANSAAETGVPSDSTASFRIGMANGSSTQPWDGRIDEVGFWKRTLSDSERATMYNSGRALHSDQLPSSLKTNLISYWDLDESSTGAAAVTRKDAISTNDLTDNNTVTSNPGISRVGDFLWVGTNGSSADDGGITAISLETDKQVKAWTTSNSGLPDNDVNSLSLGSGGLALVGTNDAGAWAPGLAGFVVDDTAATPATTQGNAVRIKAGGTTRIKSGGTVRVGPQ
jgi:hypothetical protein